ncbi:hypothetical protein [Streptomyces roseolus]|uniref:hypothetical protein n=1 Tax=Streptomyces roseolus TaxID=67358 RepID=UPI0016774C68|nr:hypothetical protein [Streptomyces roseolus]GGR63686.1 hypothetical protein GCM10010282_65900 [Streptomyces roseolus]
MPTEPARLALHSPVTRRAAVAAVTSAAAALLTAGCLGPPGNICTLIGADSGVTVSRRPADFPAGSRYRICADGTCREPSAPAAGDDTAFLQVRLPEEDGPREVTVRFAVIAPPDEPAGEESAGGEPAGGGRVVHAFSTRVALRAATPNGEKCGPTVWQAGVRVDPRKGLVGPG